MKDVEIINGYLDSIKEELLMYKDSLSEKSFSYIDKLRKEYNLWEKYSDRLNGIEPQTENDVDREDIDNTMVDDYLYEMIDEFSSYTKYKEDYKKNGSSETLDMAHTELGHFLKLVDMMFEELKNHTEDNVDERAMVKSAIKLMYQNFS